MAKATVLSVDDDENLQEVVSQYLEGDGHTVVRAISGADLEKKLETISPDVILLDLVLPDAEGLSLITKIRARSKTPIIIVSGKSDTTEKIVGLEMGADDYITKPFEMRELAARIKAVIRRSVETADPANTANAAGGDGKVSSKDKLCFEGWCLDRLQYQLFDGAGKSAELTSGEFRLLELLVMAPNRVLTRDYLFEATRSSEFEVADRAVDIQIGRIRKKINDDSKNPQLLKTVRGVGYMFCGTIK